jgi:preprotein translocase subunit SecY
MLIIMIVQAVRQVPLSYAKQMINNKMYDGQRSYLPLKVNSAGVMPIIFAQALMVLPTYAFSAQSDNEVIRFLGTAYNSPYTWTYSITMALLILIFTYFYTAIMIHPNQIAEDLKRNGGFIPGVKPGQPTADYIDDILSKITLPGALFVALVAILPSLAFMAKVKDFAQFFGGTSLLILVGVVLDTVQQVDSYLIMKKYDGLMKSGRVKGRAPNVSLAE